MRPRSRGRSRCIAVDDGLAHVCSARVDCSAEDAMSFLRAPENLASWAVGLGDARVHDGGLVEGTFPATKRPIWARIDADPDRSTICFHVGPGPDSLVPRIMIRVVPGDVLEDDPRTCVVSLIAWRQATMDDARWDGLKSGHEGEILAIKRLIESSSRG